MRFALNRAASLIVAASALECSSEKAATPSTEHHAAETGKGDKHHAGGHHAGHTAAAADPHASHNMGGKHSMLMVATSPTTIVPGEAVTLKLMIHDAGGKVVSKFEPIHEKLVHLIIVREGLDQFAHLHPVLNDDGNMTVEYAFPVAGKYHLFADHKPAGENQALAIARFEVAGEAAAAEPLVPNVPGKIAPGKLASDQIHADIAVTGARAGTETGIAFTLHDAQGAPIADLQPYLGAMGHLVIVSADARDYAHAHPAEGSGSDAGAAAGRVEFDAHFAKGGIYKGWGQFQRDGRILTVPFVIEVD